jgi:hypothetical protein
VRPWVWCGVVWYGRGRVGGKFVWFGRLKWEKWKRYARMKTESTQTHGCCRKEKRQLFFGNMDSERATGATCDKKESDVREDGNV